MLKQSYVQLEVFSAGFYFVWDCDETQLARWFYRRGLEFEKAFHMSNRGCTFLEYTPEGSEVLILWVRDRSLCTLVHELSHLTWRIMKYLGLPNTESNEECHAYIQEEIFSRCIKLIIERK